MVPHTDAGRVQHQNFSSTLFWIENRHLGAIFSYLLSAWANLHYQPKEGHCKGLQMTQISASGDVSETIIMWR